MKRIHAFLAAMLLGGVAMAQQPMTNEQRLSLWPQALQSWPAVYMANPMTYGFGNTCVGQSVEVNNGAAVAGCMAALPSLVNYNSNDAIGQFSRITCVAPVASGLTGTFSSTGLSGLSLTGGQIANLRVGMWVTALNGSTIDFRGQITGWASNGTSITVVAWYNKVTAATGTPSNTDTASINLVTSCWDVNHVVQAGGSFTGRLVGNETDVLNNTSGLLSSAIGFWAIKLHGTGSNGAQEGTAFLTGGSDPWQYGLQCAGGVGIDPQACVVSTQTTGSIIFANGAMTSGFYLNFPNFTVDHNGTGVAGGGWTLNPPNGAAGLTVNGSNTNGAVFNGGANSYAAKVSGNATSGQSFGELIRAGTTSADEAILVQNQSGGTTYWQIRGDGLMIYNAATSGAGADYVCYGASSQITFSSTACGTSTEDTKQDIVSLPSSLAEVMALRPVGYRRRPEYNRDNRQDEIGLIAQEVQGVDGRLATYNGDGTLHGVDYPKLGVLAIKAIQEQQAEIQRLRRQMARLIALQRKAH